MKILILLFICTFTINISAKEKKREISKIDYEIISESLIKKQIAFILYLGNHKINILDHNLIDMVHDIMFSENLLIENSQWARKNQYFIQNDKNLDSNLLILIESFRSKNSNKTNIIKKGGKVL